MVLRCAHESSAKKADADPAVSILSWPLDAGTLMVRAEMLQNNTEQNRTAENWTEELYFWQRRSLLAH